MIPVVNVLLGLPDESGSGKSVTLRASTNAAVAPQQCCPDVYLGGGDHTTLIHISQAERGTAGSASTTERAKRHRRSGPSARGPRRRLRRVPRGMPIYIAPADR